MASDFASFVAGRLDRLEAQNRRHKWYRAFLLLMVGVQTLAILYLLLPVSSWLRLPRMVEATHFVMVDHKGQVQGRWEMTNGANDAHFVLGDVDVGPSVSLFVNHQHAAHVILLSREAKGNRSAVMSASHDSTALVLRNSKGKGLELLADKEKSELQYFDAWMKPAAGKP